MSNENPKDFMEQNDDIQEGASIELQGEHTELPRVHREHRSHSSHSHHSSGSHSHHSHSHSSRRGSSKKRSNRSTESTKEKIVGFITHNRKYLIHTAIAAVAVVCLIGVGRVMDRSSAPSTEKQPGTETPAIHETLNKLEISVPFFKDEVSLVTPAVSAYYKAADTVKASEVYDQYRSKYSRMDVGLPVTLSYEVSGAPAGISVRSAEYLVADNAELTAPFIFNTDGYTKSVDVYHLKTGTKYYYEINLTFNNGTETSVGGSFKTAPGPRFLTVEGVYNLRDIGGWRTVDGAVIKQGLLYRGCELDGAVEKKYTITSSGVNTMLAVLGIKTDMDLREPTDNKYGTDALGAGVKHIYYSAPMYSSVFDNAEKIRTIFSDLADRDNYPVYLHCTYGQDRTGTICYLLGAVLGMDESSLMKEYQLSAFHHSDVSMDFMYKFIGRVMGLPGNTVNEKVEGWLLSIGVTEAELDSIRSIYLEQQT